MTANSYILRLDNQADQWNNASPIGSGSQGAMIYGTVGTERISFNEESIWSGGPVPAEIPGFREKIDTLRNILISDHEEEADPWANTNMGDDVFRRVNSYEAAGELYVRLHGDNECTDYARNLDLMNGILTVSYQKDGHHYTREAFASHPAGLICQRFTADTTFDAELTFVRPLIDEQIIKKDYIIAKCHTQLGNNRFNVYIKAKTDGSATVSGGALTISGASCIELYTGIFTAFKHDDLLSASAAVMQKSETPYDTLKAEHTADFSALMNRSDITFDHNPADDLLTVPQRLNNLKNGGTDVGMLSLYFQFGKYLLVSSSREDSLPANLQGVWADGLESPWNADYHTNINLQMNYWHAEESNISECTAALFRYMNDYLLESGKQTAKLNYGARGMVVHHLSDLYGFTGPADGVWGLWPLGGAWLAYHMWEHYLYTNDVDFLRNTAYDYIKNAVLFFLDTMFEKDGYMMSGPSCSPENRYVKEVNGEKKSVYLAIAPTMDTEIIGGLLDFYIETESILGIDPKTAAEAAELRAKMPPLRINKNGCLMEWIKDYDEIEPGHRHISHAFALYPSAEITRRTPELFKAIKATLDRRLSFGGGHTGWSRAWLINLFARLRLPEEAYKNVILLFTKSTYNNLFDAHPPFQIDGNFGGAAGIGEMVMQSHEGFISLLPAISGELANGSFTGLRARGGYTVSCKWTAGKVTELEISADKALDVTIELSSDGNLVSDDGMVFAPHDGMIHIASERNVCKLRTV